MDLMQCRYSENRFKRFQSGNFDVKHESRSGRPVKGKVDAILEKVEQDRHISSYNVAEELGIERKNTFDPFKKRTSEKGHGQKAASSLDYSKTGLTRNKLMLSVWWNWKSHYERSPPGKTIKSDIWCQQLMRFKQKKNGRVPAGPKSTTAVDVYGPLAQREDNNRTIDFGS
ncbi:hypothetical protein EVAR_796_1 [Eumeta japonica]|uniref:Mariner Mos1 transposase n=1 Tax=Eumeta variegata TaxID=151549 RepID=A0A4C1SF40_EUMVA|nr:hypothetical protein EVAR_796_1 [Eumeta japonica]